jgi:hypothetical protein
VSKGTNSTLWAFLGVGVVGYLALRLLPGFANKAAGNTAGTGLFGGFGQATGTNPYAATYRNGGTTLSTTGDLNSTIGNLLKALTGQGKPSSPLGAGSGPAGAGLPGGGLLRASLPDSESVLQALWSGNSGVDQSTLAGIYNVQQGAGDFAGDSRVSMGDSFGASSGTDQGGYQLDSYQFGGTGYTPELFNNPGVTTYPSSDGPQTSSDGSLDSFQFDSQPVYDFQGITSAPGGYEDFGSW